VASLNHPFGAFNDDPDPNQEQRTRDLATDLLANNVDNCQWLEVGYVLRGAVDLEHHLMLWDYLLTNDKPIIGLGNNDFHGQIWSWDKPAGAFGNWVYYDGDLTQDSLLAGLRAGRVFLGNPWQMAGSFDLRVGQTSMGGTAYVLPVRTFTLEIDLPEWINHPDWIVTLRGFAINSPDPQTADLVSRSYTFSTPPASKRFVMPRNYDLYLRAEVMLNDNESYWLRTPVAFSNPLWVRRRV
ncbi:MAG: hypothetical protein AAB263_18115, partial [Planctomycetota bacterium]